MWIIDFFKRLFRKGPNPNEMYGATKVLPQIGSAEGQAVMYVSNPMAAFQPQEKPCQKN